VSCLLLLLLLLLQAHPVALLCFACVARLLRCAQLYESITELWVLAAAAAAAGSSCGPAVHYLGCRWLCPLWQTYWGS
jgi:hypothetical protein